MFSDLEMLWGPLRTTESPQTAQGVVVAKVYPGGAFCQNRAKSGKNLTATSCVNALTSCVKALRSLHVYSPNFPNFAQSRAFSSPPDREARLEATSVLVGSGWKRRNDRVWGDGVRVVLLVASPRRSSPPDREARQLASRQGGSSRGH